MRAKFNSDGTATTETRTAYETERSRALERIERLANGRTSIPLDDVACLLPVVPEWLPFKRRRPRSARTPARAL